MNATSAAIGTPVSGISIEIVAVLVALAMAPFLLGMLTCFTKLVVVGGLLRQALGTQQVPPNSVVTGLALVLTAHIMTPVARETYRACESACVGIEDPRGRIEASIASGGEVIGGFLRRHASSENLTFFEKLPAAVADPEDGVAAARAARLLTVEAPAFLLTELQEALLIGFRVLLPFLIIDLVVGNVLMALGMMMMSPQVIGLPIKLLFFIAVDGWRVLFDALVKNYIVVAS